MAEWDVSPFFRRRRKILLSYFKDPMKWAMWMYVFSCVYMCSPWSWAMLPYSFLLLRSQFLIYGNKPCGSFLFGKEVMRHAVGVGLRSAGHGISRCRWICTREMRSSHLKLACSKVGGSSWLPRLENQHWSIIVPFNLIYNLGQFRGPVCFFKCKLKIKHAL